MDQVGRRRLCCAGARNPCWRLDIEGVHRIWITLYAVGMALSGEMEHNVRVHMLDEGLNGRLVGQIDA